MKLTYLGTAAAEGIPALFCSCETCRNARLRKGREIRTRAQALIDDVLLIDLGPDTYLHALRYDLDLLKIRHCLITHAHSDHLLPEQLLYRLPGYACTNEKEPPLNLYGSEDVEALLRAEADSSIPALSGPSIPAVLQSPAVHIHTLLPYHPVEIGGYTVTPLPAFHGTPHPYFYLIAREGKTILYAHDTDLFLDAVWAYFAEIQPHFDLVSMDCTSGLEPMQYQGHMNFEKDLILKDRLLQSGFADEQTLFVSNHFSHNGHAGYQEACAFAEAHGLLISYDGMTINL